MHSCRILDHSKYSAAIGVLFFFIALLAVNASVVGLVLNIPQQTLIYLTDTERHSILVREPSSKQRFVHLNVLYLTHMIKYRVTLLGISGDETINFG